MLEVSMWADLNLCGPTRQEANAKQTGGGGVQLKYSDANRYSQKLECQDGWGAKTSWGIYCSVQSYLEEVSSCVHTEI